MCSRSFPMVSRRVIARCRTDHAPYRPQIRCLNLVSRRILSYLRRDHSQRTPAKFISHPHPCKQQHSSKAEPQMYRSDPRRNIRALSQAVRRCLRNRRFVTDTSKIFTRSKKHVPIVAPSHPSHFPGGGPTYIENMSKGTTPRSRFPKFDKGPRNTQRRAMSWAQNKPTVFVRSSVPSRSSHDYAPIGELRAPTATDKACPAIQYVVLSMVPPVNVDTTSSISSQPHPMTIKNDRRNRFNPRRGEDYYSVSEYI